jgi:hypothetical protein
MTSIIEPTQATRPRVAKQPKISVPFPDEPGAVYMTEAEWLQLQSKLGAECAYYWVERLEEYAADSPRKFSRYKDHYKVVLRWHQMRIGDGYEWYVHPDHGGGYYKTWVIERATGVKR